KAVDLLLSRLARVVGLASLEAASTGLASWALLSYGAVPSYVAHNALPEASRLYALVDMACAVPIALAVLAGLFLWKRRGWLDVAERLVARATPLCLAGLAVFVFDARLWGGNE